MRHSTTSSLITLSSGKINAICDGNFGMLFNSSEEIFISSLPKSKPKTLDFFWNVWYHSNGNIRFLIQINKYRIKHATFPIKSPKMNIAERTWGFFQGCVVRLPRNKRWREQLIKNSERHQYPPKNSWRSNLLLRLALKIWSNHLLITSQSINYCISEVKLIWNEIYVEQWSLPIFSEILREFR